MDRDPATRPDNPASASAVVLVVPAATPTTRPAVLVMPSLQPSTPARRRLSRLTEVVNRWAEASAGSSSSETAGTFSVLARPALIPSPGIVSGPSGTAAVPGSSLISGAPVRPNGVDANGFGTESVPT